MHLAVGSHFFTFLPVVGPQAPQFQSLGSRAALRNRFRLADSFRALDATHATTSSHIEQRMFLLSTNLPQYHFMMRHQPLNLHTSWQLYSLNSNLERHLNVISQQLMHKWESQPTNQTTDIKLVQKSFTGQPELWTELSRKF